ncbi:hypothetical protein D3C73_1270480 [compost metagenome]
MTVDEAYKEANQIVWGAVKKTLRMVLELAGVVSILALGGMVAAEKVGIVQVQVVPCYLADSACKAVTQ